MIFESDGSLKSYWAEHPIEGLQMLTEGYEARVAQDPHAFDPKTHCSDCGHALIWRHAGLDPFKCRRCYEKGGGRGYAEIDLDKIDALLGPEMADRVIRECDRWRTG